MNRSSLLSLVACLASAPLHAQFDNTPPAPPELPREFRGVWVATVGNIDWPSKPGLPVETQKAELIGILETVKRLRLNTVVFQVRPAADALYPSELEPWSPFITGEMGKAPEPFYDPLAFAIDEAHARGLELHAWFNPFRAQHPSNKTVAASHVSRAHPEWVRTYGSYLWLDPGDPAARAHSLRVIADVVRRYDVDGIHIDDYFYPYQERDREGTLIQFPDEETFARYGAGMERADWRRANIDGFVRDLYAAAKQIKPQVRVGISPFGIWRPGYPSTVTGMDAFTTIYADARKWIHEGWLDYFVPQLYWKSDAPQQPYTDLLRWWVEQNRHDRHVIAGNAPYRVVNTRQNWPVQEIVHQINLTRAEPGASGNVHFSMRSFMGNGKGIVDTLATTAYSYDALVPRSPWLDSQPPAAPLLTLESHALLQKVANLTPAAGEPPFLYVVRLRFGETWYAEVVPAQQKQYFLLRGNPAALPDEIAVSAVDRHGNESAIVRAEPNGAATAR